VSAPGIVHEDVYPAISFSDVANERIYRCDIGMVTFDRLSLTPRFADCVDGGLNRRGR